MDLEFIAVFSMVLLTALLIAARAIRTIRKIYRARPGDPQSCSGACSSCSISNEDNPALYCKEKP